MTSMYLSKKKKIQYRRFWHRMTIQNCNKQQTVLYHATIFNRPPKNPQALHFLFNTTHSIQWFTMTAIASRDAINVMQRMGSHVLLFASTHCDPSPVTSLHRNNNLTPLIAILLRNNYQSKHIKYCFIFNAFEL